MSLEDELTEQVQKPTITEEWVEQWSATLSASDRKTWEAWVKDPHKPAVALFRVIRRHGYTGAESTFRGWVRNYRESL